MYDLLVHQRFNQNKRLLPDDIIHVNLQNVLRIPLDFPIEKLSCCRVQYVKAVRVFDKCFALSVLLRSVSYRSTVYCMWNMSDALGPICIYSIHVSM